MVNKILLFFFCFIALAHSIFCSVLFPSPWPPYKKKLVLAFAQFSLLQSDANSPDESILKQSKQNWALLWSTIKRPLSICISEHAPMKGYSPPPPPICLQRHHSTAKARKINALLLPVQAKGWSSPQQSVLHFQCDIQCKQDLCGRVNMCFALFAFNFCPSTAFGSYCLIQKRNWFIPVASMLYSIKKHDCWLSL